MASSGEIKFPVHNMLSEYHTSQCISSHQSPINKVDIDLNEVGFGNRSAYLLENVFTPEECQNLIEQSENLGYKRTQIQIRNTPAVLGNKKRDSNRLLVDSKEFAQILFDRIGNHLPQTFGMQNRFKLLEINERLRFLRYDPGNFFKEHYDAQYIRPNYSARTYVTLQIYLNEGMEGGETTFLHWDKKQEPRKSIKIVPKSGMILIFHHDILHEGSLVTNGQKYTIRMDVLYNVPKKN